MIDKHLHVHSFTDVRAIDWQSTFYDDTFCNIQLCTVVLCPPIPHKLVHRHRKRFVLLYDEKRVIKCINVKSFRMVSVLLRLGPIHPQCCGKTNQQRPVRSAGRQGRQYFSGKLLFNIIPLLSIENSSIKKIMKAKRQQRQTNIRTRHATGSKWYC